MPKQGGPLDGKRVLLTRPEGEGERSVQQLALLGADVHHIPTIRIVPPKTWKPLDAALEDPEAYDWLVFTSAQGVWAVYDRLVRLRKGIKARIAVVGPATAAAVKDSGGKVAAMAVEHRAEAILPALGSVRGKTILLAVAEQAGEALPRLLRAAGAKVVRVTAYRTVLNRQAGRSLRALAEKGVDWILFTSSSTAENMAKLLGKAAFKRLMLRARAASIGPVTSETLRELGVEPAIEAKTYTVDGLIEAIARS